MNPKLRVGGRIVGHVLFWGWNLLFLALLWLGLGPVVLFEQLVAATAGMIPWPYVGFGGLLLAIPVVSLGIGVRYLRHDPGRLLTLFYGVQVPLMLICVLRVFAIEHLGFATGLALLVGFVGAAGLLRTLLAGPREATPGPQALRLVAQSGYLLAGLWVALLGALLAIPMVLRAGWALLRLDLGVLEFLGEAMQQPLMLIWLCFFIVTWVVFALFPVAMVGLSIRSWQLVYRATEDQLGRSVALGTTVATVGLLPVLLWLGSPQPQLYAFETLQSVQTDADRADALAHSGRIRRGLLNAFLARERWFDEDPEAKAIARLWRDVLPEGWSAAPQAIWRTALRPFTYRPVRSGREFGGIRGISPADTVAADGLYGHFFDRPLRVAERDLLIATARQTWNWRDAQAGLLAAGERKVHLDRQDIDVEEHGDWATVTIHDVYRNHTFEQQEVFLTFSLPASAAVTGLWLGSSDDREDAFTYVVAPRGAAQAVYKAQTRRRLDPALLEQVGPQQYRLRAFPIEPRPGDPGDVWSLREEGPEFHLWIELVVPRSGLDDDAHWPMPVVSEVRNLFWDGEGWTPESLPAPAGPHQDHRAVIEGLEVLATRATDAPTGPVPPAMRVLVDASRSMEAHRDAINDALQTLAARSKVEVWCTREATVQPCPDFRADDALFWGSASIETQLTGAIDAWTPDRPLVVLTDAGSYELASLDGEPATLEGWPGAALWLVHLGGGWPAAYPDGTLDRIGRTQGGVTDSVEALLVRLGDPTVRDGWRWTVRPASPAAVASADSGFTAPAAVAAIRALDAAKGDGSLAHLDQVHRLAVDHHVVTPFSSMIVLVNDAQRDALAEAEEGDDRFDREVETGTADPIVTSVPEPTTWLLLGLGGLLVSARVGQRRGAVERRD